jgi:hypothetical protein
MPKLKHAYTLYYSWRLFAHRGTMMYGTYTMAPAWFICLGPIRFWIVP